MADLKQDEVEKAEEQMHFRLRTQRETFEDSAGCCNTTLLAETICEELNLYSDQDFTIPTELYEISLDVSCSYDFND